MKRKPQFRNRLHPRARYICLSLLLLLVLWGLGAAVWQLSESRGMPLRAAPVVSQAALSSASAPPLSSAPAAGALDLNTATAEQLEQLAGIGPVKAQAILQMREALGGYSDLRQLLEVKGIGEKTYEKILPYITLS